MASGSTSNAREPGARGAGPVLLAGAAGAAVLAALREENQDVRVVDRGSYLRVSVAGGCRVSRAAVERHARRPFAFPAELEKVMPSFEGRLSLTADEATWAPFGAGPQEPSR